MSANRRGCARVRLPLPFPFPVLAHPFSLPFLCTASLPPFPCRFVSAIRIFLPAPSSLSLPPHLLPDCQLFLAATCSYLRTAPLLHNSLPCYSTDADVASAAAAAGSNGMQHCTRRWQRRLDQAANRGVSGEGHSLSLPKSSHPGFGVGKEGGGRVGRREGGRRREWEQLSPKTTEL